MSIAHEPEVRVQVLARHGAADNVVVIDLGPSGETASLPAWTPGAHVDLELQPGLVRQYSLCGSPDDTSRWRIGVLREPDGRGGSAHVHDALLPGHDLTARGPRNHFSLVPSPRYVFIAGGIGITPILPMVRHAQDAGAAWQLFYGGRTRDSMAFHDELADLGSAAPGSLTVHPQDEDGLLDLAAILAEPRDDTAIYCCGPESLLLAVEDAASAWPAGALHVERFSPKTVDAAAAASFDVELATSGITVTVGADESILEAVTAAGVQAWSSCQEGTCGTCETVVLAGTPDHRDSVLSPDEQASGETMMICVSRSCGPRLVLEL